MRPALEPGDWAVAVAVARIGRGDVVVLEHPDRPGYEMVKRVRSIPGDVAPDGTVLAADAFWVEGDAPDESTDSRTFGPVQRSSVKGRVRLVYSPPDRRRFV